MASLSPPTYQDHRRPSSFPPPSAQPPTQPPDSPDSSSSISSGHAGDSPLPPNHSVDHIHITPSPPPSNHLAISPPRSPSGSSISSEHTLHGFSPREEDHSFHEIIPHDVPPPSPHARQPAVVNRLIREEPVVVTKMESGAAIGYADEEGSGGGTGSKSIIKSEGEEFGGRDHRGGGGRPRVRPSLSILRRVKREVMVRRAALGLRVFEFVTCLVSFSVMASDRNRGWALDSFDRYLEFRYSLSVSVLGFAYSGFQGLDLVYRLTTSKQKPRQLLRCCFDFTTDQAGKILFF
ncbi:hypothetical protein Dimus_018647 [Dionaea muscipula]